METKSLGEELFEFLYENKFAEAKELLESLSEDQRREVVRYKTWVSYSADCHDAIMICDLDGCIVDLMIVIDESHQCFIGGSDTTAFCYLQ